MKRVGSLFDSLVSWRNLVLAARNARRGKRFRPNVAEFEFHLEWRLLSIQDDLTQFSYRHGPYRSFTIYEPKRRLISAAPYRDRVVHHALCNIIEPLFERRFIFDSYACRKGKGTHAAIRRASQFAGRNQFVLKADIAKFFPSIDHDILIAEFHRRIKDHRVLELMTTIVRHPFPGQAKPNWFPGDALFTPLERSVGLPLGNQTSQLFANVMLDPLDHFVKQRLRCRNYLRYADDMLVFDSDKHRLHEIRDRIEEFLLDRRLRLHSRKTQVMRTEDGVAFLGFRVFPTHRRLLPAATTRFRRRLRAMQRDYAAGRLSWEEVKRRIDSWLAHAAHGKTHQIAAQILAAHPFSAPPAQGARPPAAGEG